MGGSRETSLRLALPRLELGPWSREGALGTQRKSPEAPTPGLNILRDQAPGKGGAWGREWAWEARKRPRNNEGIPRCLHRPLRLHFTLEADPGLFPTPRANSACPQHWRLLVPTDMCMFVKGFAVWPWGSYSPSLDLRLLLCEMGRLARLAGSNWALQRCWRLWALPSPGHPLLSTSLICPF